MTLPKELRLQRTGRELADLMIHMEPDAFPVEMIKKEIARLKIVLARLSGVVAEREGGGVTGEIRSLTLDLDAYETAILRLLIAIEGSKAAARLDSPDPNAYAQAIERIAAQLDPYMSAAQAGNVLVARAKERRNAEGGGA